MRDTDSQQQADATDPEATDHATDAPSTDHATDAPSTGDAVGDREAEHPHDVAAPHPQESTTSNPRTDGGAVAASGVAAPGRDDVDYLDREVNIFSPSTPFMRDHLRIVWAMFAAWTLIVFGPVTATVLAPGTMTSITVLGFPLHYLATAIGSPVGALVLSLVYARKRDQLDERYGIDHGTGDDAATSDGGTDEPAATDGGVDA
jgi:putative solute:sodium symporter small subunit